jgi:hypothetical protein
VGGRRVRLTDSKPSRVLGFLSRCGLTVQYGSSVASRLHRAQASMSMNFLGETPAGFEPACLVLRTSTSPLGHGVTCKWLVLPERDMGRRTPGPAGQSPYCRVGGRPGPADRGRRSGRLLLASRGSPPLVGRRNGTGAGFAPASSTLQHRALSNRAATAWCLRPQSGWRGRLPPVARRARPPDRTENLPGFSRALYLLSLTDLCGEIFERRD